jgi:hypothetical protein
MRFGALDRHAHSPSRATGSELLASVSCKQTGVRLLPARMRHDLGAATANHVANTYCLLLLQELTVLTTAEFCGAVKSGKLMALSSQGTQQARPCFAPPLLSATTSLAAIVILMT